MEKNMKFYLTVLKIALPVTLQSLLQSSFSVIDEIMIGQLGTTNIAGIGLAGKFASVYSVLLGAIVTVAGIMISQYLGKKEEKEVGRSFYLNGGLAILLAALFTIVCACIPQIVMSLYSKDSATITASAGYLRILSASFIPMAVVTMLSTMLRCLEMAVLPLVVTFAAAIVNTALNYVLIFGKFGMPELGVTGAAIATVASHGISMVLILVLFFVYKKKKSVKIPFAIRMGKEARAQYIKILLPILVCEFLWTLGENVYAIIYGHIGTKACASMTLTIPIQIMIMGALSGLSQAAGIIIGKALGQHKFDEAYEQSRKLIKYGFLGSLCLSILLLIFGQLYVRIYQVEPEVRQVAWYILIAFAIVSPLKVQNMILGGGIIRSGGDTKTIMYIDMIGTWVFGVPLGLLTAFVLKLPIPLVYFILSLEEGVRFAIEVVIFRKKKWMKQLQ